MPITNDVVANCVSPDGMESTALLWGSMTKLNRMGLRGQPYFTPLLKRMEAVIPLAVRAHMVEFVYMSLTMSLVCGPTAVQWSISIHVGWMEDISKV